jgi:hypothetical protein
MSEDEAEAVASMTQAQAELSEGRGVVHAAWEAEGQEDEAGLFTSGHRTSCAQEAHAQAELSEGESTSECHEYHSAGAESSDYN